MKKITNALELKEAIFELELKKVNERIAVKEQFNILKESLKPLNLIKNSLKESAGSSSIKGNVLTGIMGMAAGYLAKKVVFGSTINPIKKVAGTLLQLAVTGSAPKIKSIGVNLLQRFFKRSKTENTIANHEVNQQVQDNSF